MMKNNTIGENDTKIVVVIKKPERIIDSICINDNRDPNIVWMTNSAGKQIRIISRNSTGTFTPDEIAWAKPLKHPITIP